MVRSVHPLLLSALLLGASHALAQTPPETSEQVTAEQAEQEREARQEANRAQADFATRQLEQNAANQAEYEARRASYEAQMRLYQHNIDDRARAEAEYAAIKALYDRVYAQWQADVAACNAGDKSRCTRPAPGTQSKPKQ